MTADHRLPEEHESSRATSGMNSILERRDESTPPVRWKVADLRRHVRHTYSSREDRDVILAAIASIDWSLRIFGYHLCLAKPALKSLELDPNSIDSVAKVLSFTQENEEYQLVLRANIVAAIHTTRNVYEHLAQLCNVLLLSPRLPASGCELSKVAERMSDAPLKAELASLRSSHWFRYFASYSNLAKHQYLIPHAIGLSFTGGASGARIERFEYRGEIFDSTPMNDVLQGLIELRNRVVDCGVLLNEAVLPGESR